MQIPCLGFYLDNIKYGNKQINPKLLLADSHVSLEDGKLLWYAEPNFQRESLKGTFRHVNCKRIINKDSTSDGICVACKTIPKIDSFRLKLQRRNKQGESTSETTKYAYLSRDEVLNKLKEAKEQISCFRSKVFLLGSNLARLRQKASSLRDTVKEFSRRGDIKAISYNVAKAFDEGKLKEKQGLVDILSTISRNLRKKKEGKRYSSSTKDFYEVLLTMGGPRLCDFVAQNLDGPHIHSTMVWRKEGTIVFVLGGHMESIKAIADLYKKAKENMDIKTDVPYIKAEDETAIIPRPEYRAESDEVWGFCGKKGDGHICEENFVVSVGDDDHAYERLVEAFATCQVATHSRIIMINPLHRCLPRVVLLLQANCNRFTHNEVLHQWLTLDTLCESILDPVLGPGIGHACDGDTRRRKLMLNQAMSGNQHRYRPVSVELGFIMSARIELSPAGKRIVKDLYDQDSIHNDKKIINPLDHPTRVLRLGRYSAHMNHLRLVMTTFPPSIHGLRADDVSRKDRQKWEVVQRLKFLSVHKCLLDIVDGNNGATKDISVYGTWAFLYVAWHYTELFFSLHASLRERVKYAAFVVIFFSLWRNWVILTDGLTLKENFLTSECFQDVLLSCHFAVILISYFRDEYPDLECPLDLTGTDCCERYFSENGSFVKNRHNYTFLDMHTSLGYMNRLQVIKATNPDIKFPNRKHNNDFIWDKQFQQDQRKRVCDLRDYPSAGQVICAWEEGVVMAKDLARQLGMHPDDEREEGDDDDDDDDNKWFHKPIGHVDFKKSLQGMLTEDQQEVLRINALGVDSEENGSCDDEEPPSCSSEAHVDEGNSHDIGVEDIRHIVNPLLDNINHPSSKSSPTMLVPGVGSRYKSTVIAELRSNPDLSTDRLKRIRTAAALSNAQTDASPAED